jgi:hypothetical protein
MLLLLSALTYALHFIVFRDLHHILLYGLHELAFIPIEVLVVSLVLEKVIQQIEKNERRAKAKMVIGAFMSEVGIEFLSKVARKIGENQESILTREKLEELVSAGEKDMNWFLKNFFSSLDLDIDVTTLAGIKELLETKRAFLVGIFENPALSLDESFTGLVFATLHLADELSYRKDFSKLPAEDIEHLANDLKRAFEALFREWLAYLKFAKEHYPYLYSLYIRTNPFEESKVIITEN